MGLHRKRKSNNGGFSLMEVLVAVVILAVVAIPIMKAFSSSAFINRNARREENANTAAIAVTEEFKAMAVEQLVAKYADSYDYDEDTGIYTFRVTNTSSGGKTYYAGANDEEFDVTVTLDPSLYLDSDEDEADNKKANNVNSYSEPVVASLDRSSNYVVIDEIYMLDSYAADIFKAKYKTDYNERYIKKTLDVKMDVALDPNLEATTEYAYILQKVSVTVTYVYGSDTAGKVSETFSLTDNSFKAQLTGAGYKVNGAAGLKNVYILYTPFDKNPEIDLSDGLYYAADEINFTCNYDTENLIYTDINTYLVEQTKTVNGNRVNLDMDNITLSVNGQTYTADNLKTYGTIGLSGDFPIAVGMNAGPVNLYSNISGWPTGITSGSTDNSAMHLYTIGVTVKYDDETIVSITSTKENQV